MQQLRWFAASLILLAGCGGPSLVPVTGTVTVGGKPLTGAAGAVTFVPVAGGPSSAGSIKSDGTYAVTTGALPGIPAGEYQVGVTASTPPSPNASRDKPPEIPKQLVPPRYADPAKSGIKVTITAGQTTQPIALEEN